MTKELKDYPVVMTADEVCEFLRISYRTILKLTKAGKLPGRKVGREYRFVRDEIIEYIAEGELFDADAGEGEL